MEFYISVYIVISWEDMASNKRKVWRITNCRNRGRIGSCCQFENISRHLPGGNEENHTNSESEYPSLGSQNQKCLLCVPANYLWTHTSMLRVTRIMTSQILGCIWESYRKWYLFFTKIFTEIFSKSDTVICTSLQISVSARSGMWVCSRSLPAIDGSNPAGGMLVCLLWVLCVVR
jgi:hypothetical protein